jgi:hypothetical protein
MRKSGIVLALAALGAVAAGFQSKPAKEPPKSIKEIMKRTHDGRDNLCSEVRNGFAKPEDAKKLLVEYKTMESLKPPRGDEKDWKKRTGAVIAALQDLIDKKEGALGRVHAATDCASCHNAHRPGGNKK